MITLRLEGATQNDVVRAATELREAMGKRVDFGRPFDRANMIHEDGVGGVGWFCYGYQMTTAEYEQCRLTGDWPAITIDGFVITQNDGY